MALLDFGESLPAAQQAGWDARRWAAASVAERREWFELDRLARTELDPNPNLTLTLILTLTLTLTLTRRARS